jgi:2-polyprenyl-3-methyl-5-hydroxy-6-metoxy-1,4-benzoquinol methylase
MNVVERLTLEAAQADTMIAREHRHRYEFAAELIGDKRVLDLCCGSGYGTEILAAHADRVTGVDIDAATVDAAQASVSARTPNAAFEIADAVAYLEGDLSERFDVVVCFEGLEHLRELDRALELLRGHAERGLRIVASVPNGKLFQEDNPHHFTEFSYDEAVRAFAQFPAAVMVPQFLAEGSLIAPQGATETDVAVDVEDRDEPEYANHFIFCVGFSEEEVGRAHHGRMQLSAGPLFNRWAEDLKRGAWALRRENARLARSRLGKAGSAAASALARMAQQERREADLLHRAQTAEQRVLDLEAVLADAGAGDGDPEPPTADARERIHVTSLVPTPVAPGPGEDPNSWQMRYRRAAEVLIPWIEQTVPLEGKTVLEYGCGNAAVSCAFAQRAKRLIGVDIDSGWIELGQKEVGKHGLENVELELHSPESIRDAVAARRGEIDVLLLYAVLEHLTVPERLAVLRLAREVVRPDGAIVVCETPNRLIYFDHHTARMPFFHLLPDQLALEYNARSERRDFTGAVDAAAQEGPEAGLEAIARWGRAVSFHEFEVVFGDLSQHVVASSHDPILLGERPVHPEETVLARYLNRHRPDLAPTWSRYWLDVILTPQPVQRRQPFLRPWTADTTESRNVGWTAWENLRLKGPDSTLWVTLPQPTARLVVGSVNLEGRWLELSVHPEGEEQVYQAQHRAPAGQAAYTTVPLATPAQRIAVEASEECHVVFVGYEE